ncbi:ABC-three component system middle component 6 [Cellulosilyticum sp. I15G10I2]|uniref:ABC-three component system middle component 6 n=1 Tax=Cellulosilyticum sp. I15G10I2 TaxID=1892843 RepID=UPI00085C668D|nr:ABC-three component system middle component 6 [Cellulosilyticum sp. I15G10I2]
MIMPSKHMQLSASLIGLGAFILKILDTPLTVDECWNRLNKEYIERGIIKKKHSFDNFILTVDLLYMIGAVNLSSGGEIYNVHKTANGK